METVSTVWGDKELQETTLLGTVCVYWEKYWYADTELFHGK
jgi:hypothetical protein